MTLQHAFNAATTTTPTTITRSLSFSSATTITSRFFNTATSTIHDEQFFRQIRNLLLSSPSSASASANNINVEVRPSTIPQSGLGVFYKPSSLLESSSSSSSLSPKVLCLYPGVYTPPVPSWLLAELRHQDPTVIQSIYLAKENPPTRGVPMTMNAYILNLGPEVNGGYIDGSPPSTMTKTSTTPEDFKNKGQSPSRDDYPSDMTTTALSTPHNNPAWCGHLINHCGRDRRDNVEVKSFLWVHALDEQQLFSSVMRQFSGDNGGNDENVLRIPNTMRLDGSPWYFDTVSQKTVMLPKPHQRFQVASVLPMFAGAAIVAKDGQTLEPGDELFLHYRLRGPPYPDWAAGWYDE